MTIDVRDITKVYKMGNERVHALAGVSLSIDRGEFVAIMGSSGSGKSTLMNILGCLDKPTSGTYTLNGKPTQKMSGLRLSKVRNEDIGFVFQTFELLPRQTALKNVQLALLYSKKRFFGSRAMAKRALERVGLGQRLTHKPNQMSGGQRQRVAIARAIVNRPAMLLADEPTGNLDSTTSEEIITLFKELHADGQTIVMVTHEEDIAGHAERIVRLRDGKIMSDHPTDEDPIHRAFLEQSAHVARARAGASQMMREDDPTAAARDMVETTRQLDPDPDAGPDPDADADPQPDARPEPAAAGEPSR